MKSISHDALDELKAAINKRSQTFHYQELDSEREKNLATLYALSAHHKAKYRFALSENLTNDWGKNFTLNFEKKLLAAIEDYKV